MFKVDQTKLTGLGLVAVIFLLFLDNCVGYHSDHVPFLNSPEGEPNVHQRPRSYELNH